MSQQRERQAHTFLAVAFGIGTVAAVLSYALPGLAWIVSTSAIAVYSLYALAASHWAGRDAADSVTRADLDRATERVLAEIHRSHRQIDRDIAALILERREARDRRG